MEYISCLFNFPMLNRLTQEASPAIRGRSNKNPLCYVNLNGLLQDNMHVPGRNFQRTES